MKIDLKDSWIELLFLILLIIGFIFSISISNAYYLYIVVFIAGIFAGRYYFSKIGKQKMFPFFMIIIGFLIGYIIGSFSADRKIIILLFAIGWFVSHKIHKEGIIKI